MHARAPHDDRWTERAALLAGLVLAVGAFVAIALIWRVRSDWAINLLAQVAAHIFPGRETGIPTGLALAHESGMPFWIVGVLAAVQDVATLLIGYSLVLSIARGTLRIQRIEEMVHRPHPTRDQFAKRTETFGVSLIALSLWIPFLPSGALIAALLARAAGYRPRLFMPIITVSALAAAFAYTFLVAEIGERIGRGNTVLLALGLVITIGGVLFIRRWIKKRDATPPAQ